MNLDKNIEENYETEKKAINLVWANIFGFIVFFGSFILFSIPFYLLWSDKIRNLSLTSSLNQEISIFVDLIICIIILIMGIIIHEVIHGLFFAKFSENKFKSIKFGILPKEKLFTPYCHCKEILKVNHYRIAAIMPTIILGIIPVGVSLIIGNYTVLLFGILFIAAGCGDLLMILKMVKEKNNVLIYDLPDDAGFIIYRPKNK